jgi:hypothetical protein
VTKGLCFLCGASVLKGVDEDGVAVFIEPGARSWFQDGAVLRRDNNSLVGHTCPGSDNDPENYEPPERELPAEAP